MIADPGNYMRMIVISTILWFFASLPITTRIYTRKGRAMSGTKRGCCSYEELLLAANDWVKEVRLAATMRYVI